eukprot:scaffold122038_cov64-Phaeocystis_antarctica.AAC.6
MASRDTPIAYSTKCVSAKSSGSSPNGSRIVLPTSNRPNVDRIATKSPMRDRHIKNTAGSPGSKYRPMRKAVTMR